VAELVDVAGALERLGVALDRPAAAAVLRVFGVPRSDGLVDYAALGDFVHAHGVKRAPHGAVHGARLPPLRGRDEAQAATPGPGRGAEAAGVVSLLRLIGPTIMAQQRLGLDAAMTFEMHDPSSLGICSVDAFVDGLKSFDLRLGLEHQHLLVTAFSDRSGEFVDYRAFLRAAATSPADAPSLQRPQGGPQGGSQRPLSQAGDNGMLSMLLRRRPDDSAQNLSASWSGHHSPPPIQIDESPRASLDFGAHAGGMASPGRQAAVAIWGAGTPLSRKGKIPSHTAASLSEAGKWMCLTCLFADNASKHDKCDVCGAGNPNTPGSAYTVQQECASCHFLNGAFARSCDMCNRPLAGASVPSKPKAEERRGLPRTTTDQSFAIHRASRRPDGSGWNVDSDSD